MCNLSYKCENKIFGSFYMETVLTANNKQTKIIKKREEKLSEVDYDSTKIK